jgi:hypothetical protein
MSSGFYLNRMNKSHTPVNIRGAITCVTYN